MNIYPSQLFLFLAGILVFFRIHVVGILTLSEFFIAGYAIWNWKEVRDQYMESLLIRRIILAAVFFLLMQVISDLVNNTTPADYLRGWAKILFLIVNIIVLSSMSKNKIEKISFFFLGYALSLAFVTYLEIDEYLSEWKFGYGPAFTFIMALLVTLLPSESRNRTALVLFLILGIVHLMNGARSLGGITLFTGVLGFFTYSYRRQLVNTSLFSLKIIAPISISIVAIYFAYTETASSGMLGQKMQEKYNKQTSGGKNVLTGGRTEYTISIPAIMEAPILGHGSWAKNLELVKRYLHINNIDPDSYDAWYLTELGTIPTHSHILGAWTEGGIAGGVFWIYVMAVALLLFIKVLKHAEYPFQLLVIFSLVLFIWDIVFSPFGLERRITDAGFIVMLASLKHYFISDHDKDDLALSA